LSSPHVPTARRRERGVALITAIIVTLIVALITGGIAQLLIADLSMSRLTLWDAQAQYLAQAGVEHQIYLLKANKAAGAIPSTNYPATGDQRGWYATALACLLNCSGNPSARRWRITSTGEIRQYQPDGTWTVLQTRIIAVEVDITYTGASPAYGTPERVTVVRWEETLP